MMKSAPHITSSFNASGDIRLIRVMTYDSNAQDYMQTSFKADKVERLAQIQYGYSAIHLVSGLVIKVAMSLAELEEKIHFPAFRDSRYLDLSDKTGKAYEQTPEVTVERERAERERIERRRYDLNMDFNF